MQNEPTVECREEVPVGQTLRLREEELVARKVMEEVGRVQIRTRAEEFPGRIEVDAVREEVDVEHVPVGEVVAERRKPWEEDGVLVVPVYEEQLVVTKRLVLKEHLRIRRFQTSERQIFEETLRRERLVIDDPTGNELVHERFPTTLPETAADGRAAPAEGMHPDEGFAGFVKRTFGS